MKKFLGFLLAWAIGFSVCFAGGGAGSISFTQANKYTDGTALVSTDIASNALDCVFTLPNSTTQACGHSPTSFPANSVGGAVTLVVPASGGKACFTMRTVLKSGVSSDPTVANDSSCKSFAPLQPGSPGNVVFTIQVQIQVVPPQ